MSQLFPNLLCLICLLLISVCQSQPKKNNEIISFGATSSGSSGIWALKYNPAGLARISNHTIGTSFENRFLLPEISERTFMGAFRTNQGVVGLKISQFGYHLFKRNEQSLAYSMKLAESFLAAIQLTYYDLALGKPYGRKAIFIASAGMQIDLSTQLRLAADIQQLSNQRLTSIENEGLSTTQRLGLIYRISKKVICIGEVEKRSRAEIATNFDVTYSPLSDISFLMGIGKKPIRHFFGVSLYWKSLHIILTNSFHSELGISPSTFLSYVPFNFQKH